MGRGLGRGEGRKPGRRGCCFRRGDVGDVGLDGGELLECLAGLVGREDIVLGEKQNRVREFISGATLSEERSAIC